MKENEAFDENVDVAKKETTNTCSWIKNGYLGLSLQKEIEVVW